MQKCLLLFSGLSPCYQVHCLHIVHRLWVLLQRKATTYDCRDRHMRRDYLRHSADYTLSQKELAGGVGGLGYPQQTEEGLARRTRRILG